MVAEKYGATIPFMRPSNLADDHTATAPVIAHAVNWFLQKDIHVDSVCCIYATAPFINSNDILYGLKQLQESSCEYAFTVTSFPFPIQRAIRINAKGRVEMFYPEHFHSRSQDVEEAFHDAGQFYWGRPQSWLEGKPAFSTNSIPIVLPRHRVQDIDTPEDWERAELMFKALSLADIK